MSYRDCWHIVSRGFLHQYRQEQTFTCFFLPDEQKFTIQRTFFLHVALLHQTCVHCGKFLTAASRRSRDRVSVPLWPFILSDWLRIIALVSHYLTNKLIRLIPIN